VTRNHQPLSRQIEEESVPVLKETGLSHGISGMASHIKSLDANAVINSVLKVGSLSPLQPPYPVSRARVT